MMHNWRPTDRLDSILDRCIDRLDQETPETIVREYPQSAEQLAPMLHIADVLYTLGDMQMTPAAKQAGRTRLRQAVLAQQRRRKQQFGLIGSPRLATWAALLLILCIGSVSGVTLASAQALPNDPLYGWKRASERVWLNVQPTPEREIAVSLALADRRVNETKLLYQRSGQVDGTVISQMQADYSRTLALINTLPREKAQPLLKQTQTLGARHVQELAVLAQRSTDEQRQLWLSALEISRLLQLGSSTQLGPLPTIPQFMVPPLVDQLAPPQTAPQSATPSADAPTEPSPSTQPTSAPSPAPTIATPEPSVAPTPPAQAIPPAQPPQPTAVQPTSQPPRPTAGKPAAAPKPTAKPAPPKPKPTPKKPKPTPPGKDPGKGKPAQPPAPPGPPQNPPGNGQPPGPPGEPPGKGKK